MVRCQTLTWGLKCMRNEMMKLVDVICEQPSVFEVKGRQLGELDLIDKNQKLLQIKKCVNF